MSRPCIHSTMNFKHLIFANSREFSVIRVLVYAVSDLRVLILKKLFDFRCGIQLYTIFGRAKAKIG